jgi:tol-pal system protein YbgF
MVLAGGCGLFGGSKATGDMSPKETKAPPDSPVALRQDVDRLRADLAELRTRVEAAQRAGTEHADRVAQETRLEFDAMQKAMEASSRNDMQRQVEVLDAQARRIDLLEKRANDMGQALRRIEMSLVGLESQLSRVLDARPAGAGAQGGTPARAAAAPASSRPTEESPPPSSAPDSPPAAGAGLTPPAMLGAARSSKSAVASPMPGPGRETKVEPPAGTPPNEAPATAKGTDAPRMAKATPPSTDPKATASPGSSKTGTSAGTAAGGSLGARGLFDRGMESWNKGEQGQAVLDFEELIQTFPTDPLAASAQFRIGEAYYAARDFERAALEYRKAVDLAPKGKDTPQALLRLGLAYRAQKREADARQAWNQLVHDFPDNDASEEARRALRGR